MIGVYMYIVFYYSYYKTIYYCMTIFCTSPVINVMYKVAVYCVINIVLCFYTDAYF